MIGETVKDVSLNIVQIRIQGFNFQKFLHFQFSTGNFGQFGFRIEIKIKLGCMFHKRAKKEYHR
jgi:hypothetical protein